MSETPPPRLRLRVHFGPTMLGPGKADLLELIDQTGSISAAGRVPDGGGAHLSETGQEVLRLYRAMMDRVEAATAPDILALSDLLAPK